MILFVFFVCIISQYYSCFNKKADFLQTHSKLLDMNIALKPIKFNTMEWGGLYVI